MPTKLNNRAYQCSYCDHILKTEKGIKNHEKNCDKNTIIPKRRNELADEVESIRTTSKTIHEVIERLVAMWLKEGVKVTFTSYPCNFLYTVSNSHNSPNGYPRNFSRKADAPKGYPGWNGRWSGTVEVLDKEKYGSSLYFSDIIGCWRNDKNSLPPVKFIKTGSGGGGDKFSFDGMMFLYDFPLMHKEFNDNGQEYEVLKNEYSDFINDYRKEYMSLRLKTVEQDSRTLEIKNLVKMCNNLCKEVNDIEKRSFNAITNEFNKKYNVPLLKPKSMMVDDKRIMQLATEISSKDSVPHPNLDGAIKRMKELTEKINTYVDNNPEFFI